MGFKALRYLITSEITEYFIFHRSLTAAVAQSGMEMDREERPYYGSVRITEVEFI